MRIKITAKETEMHGEIEEAVVVPNGTSAHVFSKKKHIGKKVKVLYPEDPRYAWVYSKPLRLQFLRDAEAAIEPIKNGQLLTVYREALQRIKKDDFTLTDLHNILDLVETTGKPWPDLRKAYSLA